MKTTLRTILYGVLIWLIPLVFSVPFYSSEGTPTIDIFFLKSMLIVVGTLTGALFLILSFKRMEGNFLKESLIVGFGWLFINWLLDFLVLIPLAQLTVVEYMMQVGIRYLNIPIFSLTIGFIMSNKLRKG